MRRRPGERVDHLQGHADPSMLYYNGVFPMAQTAIIMVLLIACKREVACFRRNETHDEGRTIRCPFGPPQRPPLSEKKWYLKVDFWLLRFSFWQSILVLQRSMAIRTEHECMRYVIRVKGHLDPFWQEWFDHLVDHAPERWHDPAFRFHQGPTASSAKCAIWG